MIYFCTAWFIPSSFLQFVVNGYFTHFRYKNPPEIHRVFQMNFLSCWEYVRNYNGYLTNSLFFSFRQKFSNIHALWWILNKMLLVGNSLRIPDNFPDFHFHWSFIKNSWQIFSHRKPPYLLVVYLFFIVIFLFQIICFIWNVFLW